jgi:hypothetical protein
LTDIFEDTEAQKREFLAHPEKLVAYRKAIEADLNGGFASVCYKQPKRDGIHSLTAFFRRFTIRHSKLWREKV